MNPIAIIAQETAKHAASIAPTLGKYFGPQAFANAHLTRKVAPYVGPALLMLTGSVSAAIYKISTKENVAVKIKGKLHSIRVQATGEKLPPTDPVATNERDPSGHFDFESPQHLKPRFFEKN